MAGGSLISGGELSLVCGVGEGIGCCGIFAGAARRAGPDSKLILCEFVCEFEMISRGLIGRNLATLLGVVRRS